MKLSVIESLMCLHHEVIVEANIYKRGSFFNHYDRPMATDTATATATAMAMATGYGHY